MSSVRITFDLLVRLIFCTLGKALLQSYDSVSVKPSPPTGASCRLNICKVTSHQTCMALVYENLMIRPYWLLHNKILLRTRVIDAGCCPRRHRTHIPPTIASRKVVFWYTNGGKALAKPWRIVVHASAIKISSHCDRNERLHQITAYMHQRVKVFVPQGQAAPACMNTSTQQVFDRILNGIKWWDYACA